MPTALRKLGRAPRWRQVRAGRTPAQCGASAPLAPDVEAAGTGWVQAPRLLAAHRHDQTSRDGFRRESSRWSRSLSCSSSPWLAKNTIYFFYKPYLSLLQENLAPGSAQLRRNEATKCRRNDLSNDQEVRSSLGHILFIQVLYSFCFNSTFSLLFSQPTCIYLFFTKFILKCSRCSDLFRDNIQRPHYSLKKVHG